MKPPKLRTLLLDADIIAYKAAARCEEKFDFGDSGTAVTLDESGAREKTDEVIAEYTNKLRATHVRVCLSDPKVNFRKQLDETYKGNRKESAKPQLLMLVKHYLYNEYPSIWRPRLEADDVMGILATSGDRFVKGDKIIVSEDKDMRTIPAKVYNPDRPENGIMNISPLDADRFHMWQTITGDQTDGYPGAYRVGPKSEWAQEIIGLPRKELWDCVLEAYASKGYTEDMAIHQARLAFILRAHAYNHKTKKIKLWNPLWLR